MTNQDEVHRVDRWAKHAKAGYCPWTPVPFALPSSTRGSKRVAIHCCEKYMRPRRNCPPLQPMQSLGIYPVYLYVKAGWRRHAYGVVSMPGRATRLPLSAGQGNGEQRLAAWLLDTPRHAAHRTSRWRPHGLAVVDTPHPRHDYDHRAVVAAHRVRRLPPRHRPAPRSVAGIYGRHARTGGPGSLRRGMGRTARPTHTPPVPEAKRQASGFIRHAVSLFSSTVALRRSYCFPWCGGSVARAHPYCVHHRSMIQVQL